MVFTVLAAADLFGSKLNFEIDFDALPSMTELQEKVTAVFAAEASVRRPRHIPVSPFIPHRMQTYDERVELWVDLVSTTQLQDYAQVYIFQRDSAYHKEIQSKIPPPVKPLQYTAAATTSLPPPAVSHSPSREASPAYAAAAAVPLPLPLAVPVPASPVYSAPPILPDPVLTHMAASVDLLSAAASSHTAVLNANAVHAANAAVSANIAAHVAASSPLRATRSVSPAGGGGFPTSSGGEATLQEKVMIVFDEIDSSRQRLVTKEEWGLIFRRTELQEYEADLFLKADQNGDARVSFTEFQRFAELYPTVLDSLYYRLRDYWLVKKQADSLDVAQKTLDALREKEAEARMEVSRAQSDITAQEDQITRQGVEVGVSQGRERDALAVLEAAQQETERCRAAMQMHATELVAVREKEVKEQIAHDAAAKETEEAAFRRKVAAEETARAQQRLDDIMKLLEEQQTELARCKETEVQAGADHLSAQSTQQTLESNLDAARRDTKLVDDTLQVADQELQKAQERERECAAVHIQAKEETVRQTAKKDQDEHELMIRKELLTQKTAAEEASTRTVEAQLGVTNGIQAEHEELLGTCAGTRQEETPLIAQEVRLRAARDNLDQEEARLRTDHQNFHNNTGRAQVPSPMVLQSFSHSPAR